MFLTIAPTHRLVQTMLTSDARLSERLTQVDDEVSGKAAYFLFNHYT